LDAGCCTASAIYFEEANPITSADQADDGLRPLATACHELVAAIGGIGEVEDGFLKDLWFEEGFHTSILRPTAYVSI